jgi:hypothetical protein
VSVREYLALKDTLRDRQNPLTLKELVIQDLRKKFFIERQTLSKYYLCQYLSGFGEKGKEKTFNLFPLTFSPNPIPG